MKISKTINSFEDFEDFLGVSDIGMSAKSKSFRNFAVLLVEGEQRLMRLQQLSMKTVLGLSAEVMVRTAAHIKAVAEEYFLQVLLDNFELSTPSKALEPSEAPKSLLCSLNEINSLELYRERCNFSEISQEERGSKVFGELEYKKLKTLSAAAVNRLAHLYLIHTMDVVDYAQGLTIKNLKNFVYRVKAEAKEVQAIYLGPSTIPARYQRLESDSCLRLRSIQTLMTEIARNNFPLYVLRTREEDLRESMGYDLLVSEVAYELAKVPDPQDFSFEIYITQAGYPVVYRVSKTFDLWEGLIAFLLAPEGVEELENRKMIPHIVAVRGTQKIASYPGFFGSLITNFHPKGPGANLRNSPYIAAAIKDIIALSVDNVVVAGHSLGGEITSAFATHPSLVDKVASVSAFSTPGRGEYQERVPYTQVPKHFLRLQDPISQLGDNRSGQTFLIVDEDDNLPQSIPEMLYSLVRYIRNKHSTSTFLGNPGAWLLIKQPEGQPVARYSRVWEFTHRVISHHLYGPLKMAVLVSKAAWPVILQIGLWIKGVISRVLGQSVDAQVVVKTI